MTLKLSELTSMVRDFPRPIHAGECRIGIVYPPPDIEVLRRKDPPKETHFEEFRFVSVAFYRPGFHHYDYRWKLTTKAEIVFDTAI